MTVEAWLNYYMARIAPRRLCPRTAPDYEHLIERHILPAIGSKKLDKLTPRDARDLTDGMIERGLSSSTALKVHRVLAVALKYAVREGKVARNVATLVDAPAKAATNTRALTLDEALQVLDTVEHEPLGSLWAAFLLTGARQGELLGLRRDFVQLNTRMTIPSVELSWQLQRFTWRHGCAKVAVALGLVVVHSRNGLPVAHR